MLKKLTLVVLVFLFSFSAVTVCISGHNPEKGQELENFKEEALKFPPSCPCCNACCHSYQDFIIKLDDLLTKYEKAADNKKDDIKRDIQKVVADFLDKKIEKEKAKIAKLQSLINEYTAEREKVINDKVEYLTSDKGSKKIHKKKAKIEKHNKDNKKYKK
ncbi:MAG: hypothetical protein LBD17_00865 [Endomicrobium sp.]|jgi:hypothetical protein|nr:hypothetical protein [Endomicrobium sp.]